MTKIQKTIIAAVGAVCLLCLGLWSYISSQGFMETAAQQAGTIASEALSTKVELGQVQVKSWHQLQIDGVDVYDRHDKLIAHVDEAVVNISPLAMVRNSVTEGISSIDVNRADVTIERRQDNTWNYEDLISESESTNKFTAKININDSVLRSSYNGQSVVVDKINGVLDLSSYPAMSLVGTGENQGTEMNISATLDTSDMASAGQTGGRQTFSLELANVNLEDYLPFIPEGTIPEDTVKDIKGMVKSLKLAGERVGTELYYNGQVEVADGGCTILESHPVENIRVLATFNEKEARLWASGETMGQKASAHGKIIINNGSPELDLQAESDSFEPSAVVEDIPYEGPIKFKAHIAGAADNPRVDATVEADNGSVKGVGFTDLKAQVAYADSMVLLKKASLGIAGGTVEAAGSFDAKSYDFTGTGKLVGISVADVAEIASSFGTGSDLSGMGGIISGDFAFSGNANHPEDVAVYGSLGGNSLSYKGLVINELKSSLAREGDKITLDYLSCLLPGGGSFGLEGNVLLNKSIDVSFYGSEVDLSLLDNLIADVPIAGLLDIQGTMQGDIDNPIVRAKYAAHDGHIYHQPYDRLHGSAAGSLRGVKIDDFVMEHGPKTKWYAQGMMGFLGDMGINMRVDTVAARMEDIMAAVAPEQPLTGNVDNVITITGTLKDPNVTGYVHFYQGSYNGIFINGMDGDYYIKDRDLILQDFHVFTPWIDVDFNGTVDKGGKIDLDAMVHEVDLSRYNKNLPIPLKGTARFKGKLTGTIDNPLFNGKLDASDLAVNDQEVQDVGGTVRYENKFVFFDDVAFKQNEGSYKFSGNVNIENKHIRGRMDVDKGDIHSLISMTGFRANDINGTITGNAVFSGSLSEPQAKISAFVTDGSMGSYALDDVTLAGTLDNKKIYIDQLSGQEGAAGTFDVKGIVDMAGDVDVTASLANFDVGAFTQAVGAGTKVGGTLDTTVHVTGSYAAPRAEIPISIKNLQVESTFVDSIEGTVDVADRVITLKDVTAKKNYDDTSYSLVANGRIPLAALGNEMPNAVNQFDVTLSLADADLSLLPTLSKYIDWAVGPTDGRLRLQGTMAAPYITGALRVSEGAFKIKNVVKPVTDFNANIQFTGHDITIEQLKGQMGSGNFDISGHAHLAGNALDDYNLAAVFDKLDVESSIYTGPLDATLNVNSQELHTPDQGTLIVPKISGRMFVENVLISIPGELPESSDDMPLAMLDYTLELGKNVRFLSSSLGDLRLAGGAYFGGLTIHPNTSGSIYVTKGNLSYLKTNFKVYEGAINFGQADTLMPNVVLKAGTKISNTNVYLSLDGPVTSMNFKLTSDPKMGEADIIQLLTLRSEYYNKDQSDGSRFTSMLNIGLQMTILSEVENAMRNVLNLDLLTIERDTVTKGLNNNSDGSESEKNSDKNAYEVYNITLGKNISDKALVKYTQSMTTDDYSYGVDYDLSNKINLTYTRDQDNDYYAGIEARFTF